MPIKVLWFTNTPAGYASESKGYNGGGWIVSLENEIKKQDNIILAISFFYNDKVIKKESDRVTYYPIHDCKNVWYILRNRIFGNNKSRIKKDKQECSNFQKVIADFKPDIINIFGTEKSFGLIYQSSNIPIVIHIQGILTPYLNAFVPPFYTIKDFIKKNGLNPLRCWLNYIEYKQWNHNAERERTIMAKCKFFMGRTEWDKRVINLYSPNSTYFYCGEMLRKNFINSDKWTFKGKNVIISTLSSSLIKGTDMVLKTALILKNVLNLDFRWEVYGISEMRTAEKKIKKEAKDLNVYPMGVASSEQLSKKLLECSVFVHPSYIDNSPNSVCEAQILGVPVVACNTGGLSSIIEHKKTGILVPSNDPNIMASYIKELFVNNTFAINISNESRRIALLRHSPKIIINNLIDIYNNILANK